MEYAQVVRRRRMVRDYDPDRPVPADVLDRLLGYAVRAPSAGFTQGWAFLVLTEPADRAAFWAAASPQPASPQPASPQAASPQAASPQAASPTVTNPWLDGMRRAPAIVVPHSNREAYVSRYAEPDKGRTDRPESRWPVPYWHLDAGFASLLMLLGAVDAGLGACFFGVPVDRLPPYREAFGVPAEYTPVGAITIGYPRPDRRSPSLARGRRPVAAVAHRGRWDNPY